MIKPALLLLTVVRILVVFIVEIPLLLRWPVADLSNELKLCASQTLPDLCTSHTQFRMKIGLDLKDYFAADFYTAEYKTNYFLRVIIIEMIVVTLPITIAVLGIIANFSWAKKMGLFLSGLVLQMFLPYIVMMAWLAPQNFLYILQMNAGDLLLFIFLFLASIRGYNPKQKTN